VARRELCTYLDLQYLDKGIALFESLTRHVPDFKLRVVCFDDLSFAVVRELGDPRFEPTHVAELEKADPELVATRIQRSQVEYMWTATPCVIRYFRDRDGLDEITYLDADTYFFSSPEPAWDALGDGSVLVTPASSSPQHYSRRLVETTGLFIVQFLIFRSDAHGRAVLEWWRERCIEWCFARYEDGKMGDQKYLDEWPSRFDGVRPFGHPGVLGPWCIESRKVEMGPNGLTVDGEPLIFFHFMGLRRYADGTYRPAAGRFRIEAEEQRWIYDPYVERLAELRRRITTIAPDFPLAIQQHEPLRWRLQTPVSKVIGSLARARVRLAPKLLVGPYVPGGYVPKGYRASSAALPATYSASASDSSG
jgi:hypothetical protein